MRVTTTDSDNVDEVRIEDVWDGKSPSDHRPLSCRWTGETRFERIPENAKPGYYFVGGRETRRQDTKRPDNIWPELWTGMSRKQKERALEAWEVKRVAIERAREIRAQPAAAPSGGESDDEETASSNVVAVVQGASPCVPAMPVTHEPDTPQPHREKWVDDVLGSLALVTRQLSPSELRHNNYAAQALDEEWEGLAKLGTWDASQVCEYEAARKRALESGTNAHFGRLFGFAAEKTLRAPTCKTQVQGTRCVPGEPGQRR